MTMLGLKKATAAGLIAVVALTGVPATAAASTAPTVTDNTIIDIAHSGVGSWYRWGGSQWSTTDREWKGADCSGFVVKAWQVPRYSSITEAYHPYGTWHLCSTTYHWYGIERSQVWKGDVLGYPDPDGSGSASGHVVLYYYGDPFGSAMVMEAPGSGQRIRKAWRNVSSTKWMPRRRKNLIQTAGPG